MLVMLSAGWWSAILPSGANKLCFLGKRPWRGGGGGRGIGRGELPPPPVPRLLVLGSMFQRMLFDSSSA